MSSRRGKKANAGKKATKKGRTVKKTRIKDLDLSELEERQVRGGALARGPRGMRRDRKRI